MGAQKKAHTKGHPLPPELLCPPSQKCAGLGSLQISPSVRIHPTHHAQGLGRWWDQWRWLERFCLQPCSVPQRMPRPTACAPMGPAEVVCRRTGCACPAHTRQQSAHSCPLQARPVRLSGPHSPAERAFLPPAGAPRASVRHTLANGARIPAPCRRAPCVCPAHTCQQSTHPHSLQPVL